MKLLLSIKQNNIFFIKVILIFSFLVFIPFFIYGCSNSDSEKNDQPDKHRGSCDTIMQLGYCYEYRGANWTSNDAKTECDSSPGGVFAETPCIDKGIVATCSFFPGNDKSKEIVYIFYEPMDQSTAKLSCPGKFIPK